VPALINGAITGDYPYKRNIKTIKNERGKLK
jgi:hypothetical protein